MTMEELDFFKILDDELEKFNAFFVENFKIRCQFFHARTHTWKINELRDRVAMAMNGKDEMIRIWKEIVDFHGEMVLLENYSALNYRNRTRQITKVSRNGMDLIWSDYGPHHVKVRKLCTLELFSMKRIDSLRPIREDEVTAMIESIFKDCTGCAFWWMLRLNYGAREMLKNF